MTNRILVILFSLFLFAPAMLTHICHHLHKLQINRQIKWRIIEGIDKDELVLLSFHTKDTASFLRWEHSAEFEFNQQMYDVVDREIMDDTIKYWCWLDHKETKLNKKLASIVHRLLSQDQDRQQTADHLFQFLKTLYCPISERPFNNLRHPDDILSFYISTPVKTALLSPPYPPPDLILA